MIAEGIMKRNLPSAFIAILSIISTGIATILSVLNNLKIGLNMLKMVAIMKSKMAAKKQQTVAFQMLLLQSLAL